MKTSDGWIKVALILALISYGLQALFAFNKDMPNWLMWIQLSIPYAVFVCFINKLPVNRSFIGPFVAALTMVTMASLSVFCNKFLFDAIYYIKATLYSTIPMLASSIILFTVRDKAESK